MWAARRAVSREVEVWRREQRISDQAMPVAVRGLGEAFGHRLHHLCGAHASIGVEVGAKRISAYTTEWEERSSTASEATRLRASASCMTPTVRENASRYRSRLWAPDW